MKGINWNSLTKGQKEGRKIEKKKQDKNYFFFPLDFDFSNKKENKKREAEINLTRRRRRRRQKTEQKKIKKNYLIVSFQSEKYFFSIFYHFLI